ncbi:hypothetical protein HYQ44_012460 [Verticillium longisporum]|nr:hypothetical protein HYQ44_012460 [Verticillium longisporum]
MADAGDAMAAFEILNNTNEVDVIQVTITGNTTSDSSSSGSSGGGNNSAVAMSILYTITGLITLLFLIIICTGAIRAHRYPERYGPSSGHAGRPRQSRAKGLARAVLETIPIVKFGSPEPAKPDPDMELENASIEPRDRPVEQEPRPPEVRQLQPLEPSAIPTTSTWGAQSAQKTSTCLLDLNRLRNASVEERMQALRDYRREQRAHAAPEGSSEHEVDARGRRAKLADKLRDKFKIRTSPQGGSGES